MSSEPKMKTVLYAKKLKARLLELQAQRKKAIKKYEVDVTAWRKSLLCWVRDTAATKVSQSKNADLRSKYRRDDAPGFNVSKYFEGCPTAPKYPDDKLIRDIQRKIQYLAIVYMPMVHVDEQEVGRFFSGSDGDDD